MIKHVCKKHGIPMHHLSDSDTNKHSTVNTEFFRYNFQSGRFTDYSTLLKGRSTCYEYYGN